MTSLTLGSLAIPLPHVLLYLGFFAALFAGWIAGRARKANPEAALFAMLIGGLLAARFAFVARYAEQYFATPLNIVDIRDGGFLAVPGIVAAALTGGLLAWRKAQLRRPLAIATLVGACVWGGGNAVVAALDRSQQLPELTVLDLHGQPVELRALDGRPLVVNLWASWCPPCRREMPVLEAAQRNRPEVRFLLVNQGESAEAVQRFLREQGLSETAVVLDSGNRLGQATGSFGMPTTLFYDASGRLRHSQMGELSAASLEYGLGQLKDTN